MKKRYLLLSFLSCLILNGFSQSSLKINGQILPGNNPTIRESGEFLYTLATLNEPYTNLTNTISINNGEVWDDLNYFVPLEFLFELNDNLIVFLEFNGTGFQLRSSTGGGEDTYVMPFEADLIDRGISESFSLSPISYKIDGEPGDRIIKIEIKNAGSRNELVQSGTTNMFINLQLWLYEYPEIVEFRFGENSITDPSVFYANVGAVIGITDFDHTDSTYINPHFLEGNLSTPELGISGQPIAGTPAEGMVYRFTPIRSLQVYMTTTNSTSFCDPNGIATAIPDGGVGPFTFLWSNGDTTSSITGLGNGTYNVTVTDHLGDTDTGVASISNVDPIDPNISMTHQSVGDVDNGTATSSAFGGSAPYSFAWSNGGNTQTIVDLAPATYTVTVTDSEGCTGTQSVIVNHFGCVDIYVDIQTSDASCAGVCDAIIEVQAFGGTLPYVYTISEGSGGPGICSGIYYLTVTDADGCGEITDPILIVEFSGVNVQTGSTKESGPFADDGMAWVIPIEGEAPFLYEWSNGSQDSLIIELAPGTYTVTVTDVNGCFAIQDVTVLSFGCSAYTESFIDRDFCLDSCSWRITTLLVNSVGPLVYTWSTGENSIGIQNICPGTYGLTIVDEGYGDCTYVTDFTIAPTDYVAGVVDEVTHVTDTTSGAISITAIAGQNIYEYRWSGPNWYNNWDEDISGLLPGFYSVQIKSHWGCARIDSIEVKDLTVSTTRVANMDINIYPNPAKDQIMLDMDGINEFRIQLISLDGRTMRVWDGDRILEISEIPAGIYLLEGVSEAGVFRKQIAIQK